MLLCGGQTVELLQMGGDGGGGFRLELRHGEVEGLIGFVGRQQDVRGLLQ